jgi:hypothetical protein
MKLKFLPLLMLLTGLMLLLVACAGLQRADSQTTDAKLGATAKAEYKWGVGGLVEDLESWAIIELPSFITSSHIKISNIRHVSKFRSSAGHDFSDSFETCCSMKHYFLPIDYYGTRFTQPIYSPVDGIILYLTEPSGEYSDDWKINYEEYTGKKPPADYRDWNIFIRPDSAPNVWITHMHVNPLDEIIKKIPPATERNIMIGTARPAAEGYRVKAGDIIGHGLGEIIVKRHLDGSGVPTKCNSANSRNSLLLRYLPGCKTKVQLHSIFEFMTDNVFTEYQKVANVSKSDFIVTAEERAMNPLVCEGEFFANPGNADDPAAYVKLQDFLPTDNTSSSEFSLTHGPSTKSETLEALGGFIVLAADREIITSFEASGNHMLSKFDTDKPYLLVIASTGGPMEVSIENGSDRRSVFHRPLGTGPSTYETNKMDTGLITVYVEADEKIRWQIVAVRLD